MPHKSKKKRSPHRTIEANPALNPQAPVPVVRNPGVVETRRGYVLPLLLWFLGLSVGLTIIGLFTQDMAQPREWIRWLIYRRGYPYSQAILFSALAVTASVAVPGGLKALAALPKIPEVLRLILERLAGVAPGSRHPVWGIFFSIALVSFLISLYFPRCLSPNEILVSFDIFENGSLVRHVSPGETVAYAPSRFVEIEAKLEANLFNLPAPRVVCEWTHTGDGRSIQATNCKLNYQTGSDERIDPVVVSMTQASCSSYSLGRQSFSLSKSE